jgi:muramoyltetrapeptide carboxypeptidase LdcA involved in peptidoglycan recycling
MRYCDPSQRAAMEIARGVSPDRPDFSFSSTVEEVLHERLARLALPAIYGLCCGHTEDQTVLPIGVKAILDGTEASLKIIEPALSG